MRAENSGNRVALSSLRLASCLRIFDQTFELGGESESVVPRAGVHLVLTSTPGPSQYVRFQLTLLHDNLLFLSFFLHFPSASRLLSSLAVSVDRRSGALVYVLIDCCRGVTSKFSSPRKLPRVRPAARSPVAFAVASHCITVSRLCAVHL